MGGLDRDVLIGPDQAHRGQAHVADAGRASGAEPAAPGVIEPPGPGDDGRGGAAIVHVEDLGVDRPGRPGGIVAPRHVVEGNGRSFLDDI